MAKCINKKYLRRGDFAVMSDGSCYRINTTKAIANFHNDNDTIVKVVRPLSTLSPFFIGIIKDKETSTKKIAFWITEDKKYATSKFRKSKKFENTYNITLWEKK